MGGSGASGWLCWPAEASARRAAGPRLRAWRSAFEHASSAAGSMRRPIADGGHPPKLRIAGCLALRLRVEAGSGRLRLIIETSLREEIALEKREGDAQPALGARSADEGEARKLWLGRAKGRGTSSGTMALGIKAGRPQKIDACGAKKGRGGPADEPQKIDACGATKGRAPSARRQGVFLVVQYS